MCERCRIIKRQGKTLRHLFQSTTQAASGMIRCWRRIAGVNLPREKRLAIALATSTALAPGAAKVCPDLDLSPDEKVRDLTDEEITKLRAYIDSNLEVEGDLSARSVAGDQAPDGDRLLPRPAPPPWTSCQRAADKDERPHAQGSEEDRRARQEGNEVERLGSSPPSGNTDSQSPSRQEEHRDRPGAHQDIVQQHDRHPHRQGWGSDLLGERRVCRIQRLAQIDPLCRAGHGRLVCAEGHGARSPEVEVFVKGPGSGRETAIRSLQAAGSRFSVSGRHPAGSQRRSAQEASEGLGMARDRAPNANSAVARASSSS